MKQLICLLILVMVMSGCATIGEITGWNPMPRRTAYVDAHPKLTSKKKNLILEGRICRGMTKDEVRASWGEPSDINRSAGSWGVHEQWVYGRQYLYFEDGKLTSWQNW